MFSLDQNNLLDPVIALLLFTFITFLTSEGLKALGTYLHKDWSGLVTTIAALVTNALVLGLNLFYNAQTPENQGSIKYVIGLLVALVVATAAGGMWRTAVRVAGSLSPTPQASENSPYTKLPFPEVPPVGLVSSTSRAE